MAEYKHFLYGGANYGLNSDYEEFQGSPIAQDVSASNFAMTTNPQMANQLKAVSDSLNTGAKSIEVQFTFPQIVKAIPNQHAEELYRLKKLVGVEFTLHGPMLEPTGVDLQNNKWTEHKRIEVEREMWDALKKGHKIDPKGNTVVTFHASTGIPEPISRVMTDKGEKEVMVGVINLADGAVGQIEVKRRDYLKEKESVTELLKRSNEERWNESIEQLNFELRRAKEYVNGAVEIIRDKEASTPKEKILEGYDAYNRSSLKERKDYEKFFEREKLNVDAVNQGYDLLKTGDVALRGSISRFKGLFSQAYELAEKTKNEKDRKVLEEFGKKWRSTIQSSVTDSGKIEDYTKLNKISETVTEGLNMLNEIKAPEILVPIKDFAIDKTSETFSNIAYKGFKEFKETAPVISLENHPAGPMSGLNRAEDIRDVIKKSRDKFVEKAVKDGVSESEARRNADKLIGATWDVGHINMLKKYGYDDKYLKEQMKTISPYVNKMHLSDNFGFDHAELPMGMGNVPTKAYEKILKEYGKNVDKIKRVIEAGDWFQHFNASSPLPATLASYGSSIYGMKMAPYWNQQGVVAGGYHSGFGNFLPESYFATFGSGFSNLPVLGGPLPGNRGQFSGSPSS